MIERAASNSCTVIVLIGSLSDTSAAVLGREGDKNEPVEHTGWHEQLLGRATL